MERKMNFQYQKISEWIEIISNQPEKRSHPADAIRAIGLEQAQFEKLLKDWSGLSLEQFLNFINPKYNRNLLNSDNQLSMFGAETVNHGKPASDFTRIIPMTTEESGEKGSGLKISYGFYDSPFGQLIAGSTTKGVCYMAFDEDEEKAVGNMKNSYCNAELSQKKDDFQAAAISIFDSKNQQAIKLHIKGSDFQLLVWNQLLKIPMGRLVSYHQLANELNMPTASRAVGTAIGRNPVAYIVPCHRVMQSGGNFGGYMWGSTRKMAITAWEMAACLK